MQVQECCWFAWCLISQMAEDSRDVAELGQRISLGARRRNAESDAAVEGIGAI